MLQNISWSAYWTFVSASLLMYYAWVLLRFYRHDILHSLKAKQPLSTNGLQLQGAPVSEKRVTDIQEYQPKSIKADQSKMVQAFTDEIKAYTEVASSEEAGKENIIKCLGAIAKKYPALSQSEYRGSLDHFLASEAEMNCAVSLRESEMRQIWGET